MYRPLSFLAIIGLSVGGLYTALVVLTSAVALIKGAPFFLPNWMVLMAVAGAVVSFLGARQIRNAEGVLAGEALAQWGLWLSVVTGVGYSAYVYVTGWALTQQANRFLTEISDDDSGFFPRLRKGTGPDITRAFTLALPYDRRSGANPKDPRFVRTFDVIDPKTGTDGMFTQFVESPLVVLLTIAGRDAEVEPLGVQEWKYEQGGYQVIRSYKVTTPEVETVFIVPAWSTEGESSDGQRKWYVNIMETRVTYHQLTPFGREMRKLRDMTKSLVDDLAKPSAGFPKVIFPDSLPGQTWKDKIPQIVTSGKAQAFMVEEDDKRYFRPPMAWRVLPDRRLRLDLRARLQQEPAAGAEGFRAQVIVHVETNEPYDPRAGGPAPTWKVESLEVTRFVIWSLPEKKMRS